MFGLWQTTETAEQKEAKVKAAKEAMETKTKEETLLRAAGDGNLATVRSSFNDGVNINCKESAGWTPLHYAARYGHFEIVRFLLERGAEIDASNNYLNTPLHYASQNNKVDVVRLVLAHGANVNATNYWIKMPRTLAGEEGHVQVQELLRKHPETIQLVKALREKRIRDASTLLEQEKINVNHYEPDGTTLLHLVLATQDLKLLATMLENPNLAIDATDSSGRTALAIALATGNFEATYALLQSNARLDAVDTAIVTAILRHAASTNDTEMVAALLKHGVRPAATNEKGETALHFAAANGHTAIVQTLLENDKSLLGRCDQKDVAVKGHSCINATNQAGESPLFVATANGHVDVVKALVQAEAKTHHLSNDGSTLLHAAAIGGNPRVLEYILPLCCDLEACDEMKRTPLYVAAEKGHTSAVNTLFDSGASVFAIKKGDNSSVFMVAAGSNHAPAVKALLKKLLPMPTTSGMSYKALTLHRANLVAAKAHLALRNTKLQTAVDVASGAVRNQFLAANTFVEAELHRLEQATQSKEAALAAAITARDWTTTLALLGEGVSAMASQDQEALVAAVTDTGNRELLRALLSMAVDANQLESLLQQALAGAVANNKVLLVMDVLHTFANTVHVTTTSGPSPLHIAAATGSVVLLSMLLACPTLNIDAVNEEGYTALALAVQTNQVDAALVLLSVGANVSILLPDGSSVLHVAAKLFNDADLTLLHGITGRNTVQ